VSNRKKKITLAVNGQERIITADPESSLLDAIRDDMRESSVQLRCGEGRGSRFHGQTGDQSP